MKRLPMRKIRDVLRLSAEGLSVRQISASLSIGRTTLQGYLEGAKTAAVSWPLPTTLTDTELERLLYPRTAQGVSQRARCRTGLISIASCAARGSRCGSYGKSVARITLTDMATAVFASYIADGQASCRRSCAGSTLLGSACSQTMRTIRLM